MGNLTRLTVLRLGRNDLSGTIPPELRNLAALEYFDTDGNRQLCPPADPGFLAWLREKGAGPFPCRDPDARLLPSALMREDGNGMSLALPDDLRNPAEVTLTVSDPSVVAASVASGWLALSPRGRGTAEVEVVSSGGARPAIAEVAVRAAVGTFGIDIVLDQSGTARYGEAMVEAADWWSEMLDGTEWPDRRSGCPSRDPFAGKVTALADELLIGARVEATAGGVVGYASGCFFPTVAGGVPALDPEVAMSWWVRITSPAKCCCGMRSATCLGWSCGRRRRA